MTSFGGLGGSTTRIPWADWAGDLFAEALERACGARIRESDDDAAAVWAALANVTWAHRDGHDAGYSFRLAGDLLASIRGAGTYIDWYCSARDGQVAEWIAEALAAEGWTSTVAR